MHTRTKWILGGSAVLLVIAVVIVCLIVFLPKTQISESYWPAETWRTAAPEEQGFDSVKLTEMLQAAQDYGAPIDSLLIIRHGYLILDAYFYPFANHLKHDLASVTKTFTTTLVGIAIDQGLLNLDDAMLSLFPDRQVLNIDEQKEGITIRDLVSMRNGFQSGCKSGDEATLNAMRANEDWLQAALDRKVVQEPGRSFCYDSPGMHILSGILQQVSGMSEAEFAQRYLFEPLHIGDVFWDSDPQGLTRGWGDLLLKPVDAAKLGYLWLNGGVWDGQQVVSQEWVDAAVTEYSNKGSEGYGYGWWTYSDHYDAMGRNGQTIRVYPELELILVVTAHGMDMADLEPYLEAAFLDAVHPLPSNPTGVADLQAKLAELTQGSDTWRSVLFPEAAGQVSGQEFTFTMNPDKISSMIFMFDNTDTAALQITIDGMFGNWQIGLDGEYRNDGGRYSCRGYWKDEDTFALQIFDGMRFLERDFTFSTGTVKVTIVEAGISYEGMMAQP